MAGPLAYFVIRISGLFHHSTFGFRHFATCRSYDGKVAEARAHFQMEMSRGRGNLPAKRTMNPIKGEQLLTQLNWRYATKKFDPTRKVSPEDWAALETAFISFTFLIWIAAVGSVFPANT
jgi:hypothetical protein